MPNPPQTTTPTWPFSQPQEENLETMDLSHSNIHFALSHVTQQVELSPCQNILISSSPKKAPSSTLPITSHSHIPKSTTPLFFLNLNHTKPTSPLHPTSISRKHTIPQALPTPKKPCISRSKPETLFISLVISLILLFLVLPLPTEP